jgi:hypothetical protein
VGLPPWQDALVLVAVFLGPTLGVALVLTGRPFGVELFTASMAAGLSLGVALHFLVENPDHVHAVGGPWQLPFGASAVAVAVVSAVGTATGLRYWVGGGR